MFRKSLERLRSAAIAVLVLAACNDLTPVRAAGLTEPVSSAFDRIGTRALSTGVAPGVALAVVHRGRIVAEQGFGVAELPAKTPVTASTAFAIGSLSKQFTAAAIVLLARDGKLSLDDELQRYEPALPNAREITLRMLLTQTSGLHNYPLLTEHAWPTSGPISVSQIVAILALDPPDFPPGVRYGYSNANYAALTAVVERVSGEPAGDFLRRAIFEPLGMARTDFGFAGQARERVAVGYAGGLPATPALSLDLFSGAGGMISSAHDLALWDRALLAAAKGVPSSPLDPADVTTLWNAGRLSSGAEVDYAMGWVPARLGGHRELWHDGLAPGVGGYCYNAVFPDDELAIAVLTNGFEAIDLTHRIVREVAALYGLAPESPDAPSPSPSPNASPGASPSPGASASPSAAATGASHVDLLARGFWDGLGTGSVDRSLLTPTFAALLTPAFLESVGKQIAALGPLRSFTRVAETPGPPLDLYRYELLFESGEKHEWVVAIDADGKIAGSRFVR